MTGSTPPTRRSVACPPLAERLLVRHRTQARSAVVVSLSALASLCGCGGDGGDAVSTITGPTTPAPTVSPLYDGQPASRWAGSLSDADAGARLESLTALASLGVA